MCRGKNGTHITLLDGVTYCGASGTVHIDLCRAAEGIGGQATDGIVRPFWVMSRITDLLDRQHHEKPVRFFILGTGFASKKGACHDAL